jgi:hypothetical protein
LFFFFEEAKMEYIIQNKEFFLAQGVLRKEQSHKHMYKGKETDKQKLKNRERKNISQCPTY